MTSTTDTAEHPEIDEISDLTEGLLSPSRTEEVREHLNGCELCADVHASLEEIRGTLGTLPGPVHMPADIAGRIDAALAAEALLDTKAPAEAEDKDEAEAQSASPVSRETTSADSPTTPADRPSGHPRAATGPGRGGRARTRRRRGAALGAVFTAAAIGLGVLLLQNGGGTPTGAPESGTPRQASSALSFSENKLESQVQNLLTEESSAPSDSSTSKPSVDIQQSGPKTPRENSPMRGKTVVVPDCIQRGTGRQTPALAIERGDYKGTTAYLVVLPHASDPAQVSAYVIDATCVKQPSSAPGKLLLTHSYTRR
ncbi:zf-HC2 domain-containing protein [Streptomyces sp. NBC_01280]|uniref:anti-sigma factor family protein n=1 Tax=unclassified Streptomyces TaxID=2593676 RepID=UPI0022527682|nr:MULTISPECIES: zf-HC2 domain-containing protein [unclassified Streptomyces]MCX5438414.1 zf-HC2 domain-containing protein [Streptomyces sp. NBC_00063]WSE16050.1 zf-HC2 domain-containing protein [Streptomyces sp. NBC_01397]